MPASIDIGDGLAVVFKMESHNHPSYIEPYQGAATGVGGILRDVFTMGARPIACLNSLSASAIRNIRRRGIWFPAWSPASAATAIPSACRRSAARCASTPATTATISSTPWRSVSRETDKIFYAAASGVGMPIVYLGSKTGRDGIHGASMASAEFDAGLGRKAPDGASGRSVFRKAAAGSLPRDHGQGLRHRHPGHGRGRA